MLNAPTMLCQVRSEAEAIVQDDVLPDNSADSRKVPSRQVWVTIWHEGGAYW